MWYVVRHSLHINFKENIIYLIILYNKIIIPFDKGEWK